MLDMPWPISGRLEPCGAVEDHLEFARSTDLFHEVQRFTAQ